MKRISTYVLLFSIIAFITVGYLAVRHRYGDSVYVAGKENPYHILIDVEISQLTVFKDGIVVKTYPCAGGKRETPSPIGTWEITDKSFWGGGFGGRWLGLNVPWGKYGIHGTLFPESIGSNISHGCIRLHKNDIKELYDMLPIGTRVTIIDGCYGVWGRGFRTLKPGMCGADVMEMQRRLKELGYYSAAIDGIYGAATQNAVHSFQKASHIEINDIIQKEFFNKLGFFEWE